MMFSLKDHRDRLSETLGIKLNSGVRQIDVRIIDNTLLLPHQL